MPGGGGGGEGATLARIFEKQVESERLTADVGQRLCAGEQIGDESHSTRRQQACLERTNCNLESDAKEGPHSPSAGGRE